MTRRPQLARILIVGLCFLLALFLCIQAAHGHAKGCDDPAHCGLCLVSHSAALPAAMIVLLVAERVFALFLCGLPRRDSVAVIHAYYIRPPPASL